MRNTSSRERFHGTLRARLAPGTRTCRQAAQRLLALERGLSWLGRASNLCGVHQELSTPGAAGAAQPQRPTPARASGPTDQLWRRSEV